MTEKNVYVYLMGVGGLYFCLISSAHRMHRPQTTHYLFDMLKHFRYILLCEPINNAKQQQTQQMIELRRLNTKNDHGTKRKMKKRKRSKFDDMSEPQKESELEVTKKQFIKYIEL